MAINRRRFLLNSVLAGAAGVTGTGSAGASTGPKVVPKDCYGVLMDISKCIGCRKCEWACNQEPTNGFKKKIELRHFEDLSVLETPRRHSPEALTVVNSYPNPRGEKPIYTKDQCMHCADPACMSACLVTAFKKEKNGAVSYDAWRCMGCRYCLVACPFGVPRYEYENPLTPRVRKCTMCYGERTSQGKAPACVSICPPQALTYGPRSELLKLARDRIQNHPGEYVDKIYGEHEVGGTCWMYISKEPFENLGFLDLPHEAPPRLLEGIQHSVFKHFIPPVMLFGLLGAVMWNFRDDPDESDGKVEVDHE